MIHPLLIGLVTGLRSMSPLAIVSEAARRDLLPPNGAPRIIGTPLVAGGMGALALGELAGDKWDKAPDRIVPAGLLARIITGGWRRPPWPRPRGAGKRWRSAWPAR